MANRGYISILEPNQGAASPVIARTSIQDSGQLKEKKSRRPIEGYSLKKVNAAAKKAYKGYEGLDANCNLNA